MIEDQLEGFWRGQLFGDRERARFVERRVRRRELLGRKEEEVLADGVGRRRVGCDEPVDLRVCGREPRLTDDLGTTR